MPLAFAVVPQTGRAALFVDGRKLSNDVRDRLEGLADVREPADFVQALAALGQARKTVKLDQATAADALARLVITHGGKVARGACPIALMKAVKNQVEISGARAAHIRDGAAVTRFLAWFDREAARGTLTEIDAVAALESFRRDTGLLKDISFPTISGAGPDGAIVHYRVTSKTNRAIAPGELFLIDSGGQYQDGTTDITRTVAVGEPTAEMRERFTRVLKGHIAIARAVFPDGTTGAQLDSFARQFLWAQGLDFDHGTGHGVGSYLSVHEGPARISKLGTTALRRGMILSNEPGYYKAGAYGIRIENLVLVVEAAAVPGAEKPLNAFETLTLAPIDRRLIVADMLTPEETEWLDGYHARVARDAVAARRRRDRARGSRPPPARSPKAEPAGLSGARPNDERHDQERGASHAMAAARPADRHDRSELAFAQHPGAGDPQPGGQIRSRSRQRPAHRLALSPRASRWHSSCLVHCPTVSAAGRSSWQGLRSPPSPAPRLSLPRAF